MGTGDKSKKREHYINTRGIYAVVDVSFALVGPEDFLEGKLSPTEWWPKHEEIDLLRQEAFHIMQVWCRFVDVVLNVCICLLCDSLTQ